MISAIEYYLGQYVPLNGEGIASLNIEWLLGATLTVMTIWFIYKIILTVFKGLFNV